MIMSEPGLHNKTLSQKPGEHFTGVLKVLGLLPSITSNNKKHTLRGQPSLELDFVIF